MAYYMLPQVCPRCSTKLQIETVAICKEWTLIVNWACLRCLVTGVSTFELASVIAEATVADGVKVTSH